MRFGAHFYNFSTDSLAQFVQLLWVASILKISKFTKNLNFRFDDSNFIYSHNNLRL